MFLLLLVLAISVVGLVMNIWFRPNLVDAKLFMLGIAAFRPVEPPASSLFLLHLGLVLALVPFLPTHIFTAPLVMLEARKRQQALPAVIHDAEGNHGR
jgi:hypothetical protein